MGEDPVDAQIFQTVHPGDGGAVPGGQPQPVHAGIQGQVDPDESSLGGKRPAVSLVGHRLGEMPAAEEGDLTGRGVAQNEDGAQHPGLPKGDALSQTGHPEGPHPVPPQAAGHRHRPVAVAVRFDHRHQRAAGGQGGAEGAGVVPQGVQVQLLPGPAAGGGAEGAQGVQHQGGAQGERRHGAEVGQAVLDEQGLQPCQLCSAPHQHDAPGVEEVDQQGQPAGGAVLPPAAI